MRDSLSKSRRALTGELAAATSFDPGDDADWERLEEALIAGDVGVRATAELVRRLEARGELADLNAALAEEVAELFGEPAILDVAHEPAVILVVGVNGTGKTTTIGKLSARLTQHGRSVVVAAADTYRAAAEEQLEIWAERAGADFVGSERGGDPAAVAYDAVEAAMARGRDVVVVDTAGRLHTQTNLMEELVKVRRVLAGRLEGAPARDTARRRRHHRAERRPAGSALQRSRRCHGRRAHEARRLREGRSRDSDRVRARLAGEARRSGRGAGGPAAVRSARLRAGAGLRLTHRLALDPSVTVAATLTGP